METTNEYDWYDIPMEKLGLSIKTINTLLRTGMTSVGDCVDSIEHIRNPSGTCIWTRWSTDDVIINDVLPILTEHGYWQEYKPEPTPDDFAPQVIEEIKEKLISKGYWQAK